MPMWRQAPWNDAGRSAAMLSRGQGTGARLKYRARPSRARSALTQLGSRNSRNDWMGATAVLISLPEISRKRLRDLRNNFGGHHRFVALQVDHNILGCQTSGAHSLGNSIRARRMTRRCHHAVGAKLRGDGANPLIVRCHEHGSGPAVDGALPHPLNQRPIADLQQRLCRQPSGGKARRYDDVKFAATANTQTGS